MSQTITVATGEHREGTQKSVRTYLFYVSPTGKETPLPSCPYIKKTWSRPQGQFGTGERLSTIEYSVSQPVVVKLWTDSTTFGRPKQMKAIQIEVAEIHPEIRLTGFDQFGEFRGNAKVLLSKSQITVEQLERDFSYEILKAPVMSSTKATRSLVFLKRRK